MSRIHTCVLHSRFILWVFVWFFAWVPCFMYLCLGGIHTRLALVVAFPAVLASAGGWTAAVSESLWCGKAKRYTTLMWFSLVIHSPSDHLTLLFAWLVDVLAAALMSTSSSMLTMAEKIKRILGVSRDDAEGESGGSSASSSSHSSGKLLFTFFLWPMCSSSLTHAPHLSLSLLNLSSIHT